MGGKGSGRYSRIKDRKFNISKLGQVKLSTIGKLLDSKMVSLELNGKLKEEFNKYDAIVVDDKINPIVIKGWKKILEIE